MTEVRRPTAESAGQGEHAKDASDRRLPFEPALEGLRGFALLGMLCEILRIYREESARRAAP